MRHRIAFWSAGLLLGLCPAALGAQSTLPVYRGAPPRYAGVYRAATGEFVPAARGTRSGPAVLFNNTTRTTYYGVPGARQEWIDEGGLLDRNNCRSDQINGFQFGYCSTQPDATQSGGTIVITFYDETAVCTGPPDWPRVRCAYAVPDLPLGTATGGVQCWVVDVELEGGLECPATLASSFRTEDAAGAQRLFGWGFAPLQPNTGPRMAGPAYRTDNSFTWYDRTIGFFNGCFWFGGQPYASFHMQLLGPQPNSRVYRRMGQPRPLDRLVLRNTTPVDAADPAPETWQVMNPRTGRRYWLLFSQRPQDRDALGGRASLLVRLPFLVDPSPVEMPGGVYSSALPAVIGIGELFVQALETSGAPTPAHITAVSNGLAHCF
ncbi:MAG: hypothetical protein EYC70_01735 [Planctomycetota bacterium]|nr:MAG: hypothetical protein EYC70_01735 [Planctomycetota bacterium]